MPNFRYSGWDGTQQVMPFDADAIMEAISEDVLAHGDLRRALEKLMQQGFKFQSGERMPGLRDLLERLKQQRQDALRHNNMDSVVKDIQQRLEQIKQTERAGIDRRVEEGLEQTRDPQQQNQPPQAHDQDQESQQGQQGQQEEMTAEQREQLQKMLEKLADRHRQQIDNLPKDIGGQIKGLREYDFMDPDARQQFEDLLAMLQQQMVQNTFSGLQQG
ncbi:MAG: VWA domain-containing protein, partial [Chloroflexia bacterium]